jgi:hypothetical protein
MLAIPGSYDIAGRWLLMYCRDLEAKFGMGRVMTDKVLFNCPNCNALYQIVKIEAGPETTTRQITCRPCGAPLPPRQGKFIVRYFLLRTSAYKQKWGRPKTKRSLPF